MSDITSCALAMSGISSEVQVLLKELVPECLRIRDRISSLGNSSRDQDELNRTAIAKKNTVETAQLGAQIVQALDSDSVLLALIGLKSLLENVINTKYAFCHPDHRNDTAWTYRVCRDYFDRGNDPTAPKSKLDEKTIGQRAREVKLPDLYVQSYGGLCNFAHMLVHTGWVNDSEASIELKRDTYVTVMTSIHDICEYVRMHFSIYESPGLRQRVVAFRDRHPCTCDKNWLGVSPSAVEQ